MGRGRPRARHGEVETVAKLAPLRDLTATEKRFWSFLTKTLQKNRAFVATDAITLTLACDYWTRKEKAREALAKDGYYLGGKRHPALTDMDNADRNLMAVLRELGMTAASMKNVTVPAKNEEADAMAEFRKK